MLHLHAAFAEEEARRISIRTKEALAVAKRRGVLIGATGRLLANRHQKAAAERAKALEPIIARLHSHGFVTIRSIRDELNRRGVSSPGHGRWHLPTLHRTLQRLRNPAPSRKSQTLGSASPSVADS